jgi:multidrug efflux pump
MVVAQGAGSLSQQALGTGVMGGMIAVAILALLMVPVFFVFIQGLFLKPADKTADEAKAPEPEPVAMSSPQPHP